MNAPAIPRDIPVNQIIVTTVETVRNIALMQLLVQHQKAMMVIGPTGTGKSVYVTVRKFFINPENIFFVQSCAKHCYS